ncbi:MAG: VWA domain-containing protein [Gammaproteobacteria bacterium]|nr:VWA domain-containing protein [Gammaproteobacteria bacterium]
MIDSLHWLRPAWLLALLPLLLLLLMAWRHQRHSASSWRNHIDPHLLGHLLLRQPGRRQRWPLLALAVGWLLAVIALAGPVWQRIELPLDDQHQPTVLVLNLSPAMSANDETPDRLSRARHKTHDLITALKGAAVALVIYADSPFVAAPLTDDGQVILNMLPELSGDLMPPFGDRADLALRRAGELLRGTAAASGRVILISNGLGDRPDDALAAAAELQQQGYSLSVLGVGSEAGVKLVDRRGRSYLSRRDGDGLAQLAEAGGGHYAPLTAGDSDWQTLLGSSSDGLLGAALAPPGSGKDAALKGDQWQEQGHWLLLLPVALAALAFRRGWLGVVLACGLGSGLLVPSPAEASWRDWWQTPDQQASKAFEQGQYEAASSQFRDPAWAAAARYKAGDYQQAAEAFQAQGGVDGLYNAANALARAGDYQQALAAYDEALKQAPEHEDARYNRELVAKLLEQQQKQQDEQQQQDDQQQQGEQQQQGDQQQQAAEQQTRDQVQQQMDKALAEQQPGDEAQPQSGDAMQPQPAPPAMTAEEQTREQLLRRVPDDPTGLLRARIYYHYNQPRRRE